MTKRYGLVIMKKRSRDILWLASSSIFFWPWLYRLSSSLSLSLAPSLLSISLSLSLFAHKSHTHTVNCPMTRGRWKHLKDLVYHIALDFFISNLICRPNGENGLVQMATEDVSSTKDMNFDLWLYYICHVYNYS